jgi:hypothetical protein
MGDARGDCAAAASHGAHVGYRSSQPAAKEIHFPHSLGLLDSAFTYYTGWIARSLPLPTAAVVVVCAMGQRPQRDHREGRREHQPEAPL